MSAPSPDFFVRFGLPLVGSCLLLTLMASFVYFRSKVRATRIGAGLAIPLLLACAVFLSMINPGILDPRFRAYQRFYNAISPGMSKEQVLTLRDLHYAPDGSRKPPEFFEHEGRFYFFMNPEGKREPNCEGIFLTISNGTVVGKSYSPD
jgi:hypothetical protein